MAFESDSPTASQQQSGLVSVESLRQYPIVQGSIRELKDTSHLRWCKIVDEDCCVSQDDQVMFRIPLPDILENAPYRILLQLAKGHSVSLRHGRSRGDILAAFATHTCDLTCHRSCVLLDGTNPNLFQVTQPHPAGDEPPSVAVATQTVFQSQGTESTQMTLIFDENSQADGVNTPASSVASNSNDDVKMVGVINDSPPSFPPKVLPISKRIDIIASAKG